MSEKPGELIFDRDKKLERPGVRWDRQLRRVMEHQPDIQQPSKDTVVKSYELGMKRYIRQKAIQVLKRPMTRIRDFMNTPIFIKIDAASTEIHQNVLMQQKFISEYADRVQNLERLIADVRADVGYLHQKADENALKSRPVIHRSGGYAVPLADGYIFIPEEEETLLLMYTGASTAGLEPGTRRILQAVLEPGDYAIDVGASVGLHTLALARAVGEGGRVEAFEAEPRLETYLNRTLAVNGLSQVKLHQLALGAKNGTASFHVAQTIGHSSLYDLGPSELVREKISVPLKKLDSVIEKSANINLIKIDVEGAELDVIRGAKRVLKSSPECAIVAECGPLHLQRTGVSVEDWFSEFASHDFNAYGIREPNGLVHSLDLQWVASQDSVNVLFLRSNSSVKNKLFNRLNLLHELD